MDRVTDGRQLMNHDERRRQRAAEEREMLTYWGESDGQEW